MLPSKTFNNYIKHLQNILDISVNSLDYSCILLLFTTLFENIIKLWKNPSSWSHFQTFSKIDIRQFQLDLLYLQLSFGNNLSDRSLLKDALNEMINVFLKNNTKSSSYTNEIMHEELKHSVDRMKKTIFKLHNDDNFITFTSQLEAMINNENSITTNNLDNNINNDNISNNSTKMSVSVPYEHVQRESIFQGDHEIEDIKEKPAYIRSLYKLIKQGKSDNKKVLILTDIDDIVEFDKTLLTHLYDTDVINDNTGHLMHIKKDRDLALSFTKYISKYFCGEFPDPDQHIGYNIEFDSHYDQNKSKFIISSFGSFLEFIKKNPTLSSTHIIVFENINQRSFSKRIQGLIKHIISTRSNFYCILLCKRKEDISQLNIFANDMKVISVSSNSSDSDNEDDLKLSKNIIMEESADQIENNSNNPLLADNTTDNTDDNKKDHDEMDNQSSSNSFNEHQVEQYNESETKPSFNPFDRASFLKEIEEKELNLVVIR